MHDVPRKLKDLAPTPHPLLGAGPTNPEPRALRKLGLSSLGRLDPECSAIKNEASDLFRLAWKVAPRSSDKR